MRIGANVSMLIYPALRNCDELATLKENGWMDGWMDGPSLDS